MTIIPRQAEADEEVFSYWIKKLNWSNKEFAALYCGVNPLVLTYELHLEDQKKNKALTTEEQNYVSPISEEQKEMILEIQLLIRDRLPPQIFSTPSYWRSMLGRLDLSEPPWMKRIKKLKEDSPKKGKPEKQAVPPKKPIDPRVENTLLTIIAALCNRLDIDYKAHGAASQIAELTERIGAPVDHATAGRWLKQITKALESRGK